MTAHIPRTSRPEEAAPLRRPRTTAGLALAALLLAAAPPLPGRAAGPEPPAPLPSAREIARQLFSTRPGRTDVRITAGWIGPDLAQGLRLAGKTQPYYGAFAASPDRGLYDESATAAVNYHDLDHAAAEALASCNARLKKGERPCVVVAEILPKGFARKAPRITLSMSATRAFRKSYLRARRHKAFAVSRTSGAWGMSVDARSGALAEAQAVANCRSHAREKSPSPEAGKDCTVITRD